jgi:hypothetical protein
MILITSEAAQAVDALGSQKVEFSIVPLDKEDCSRRCSEKDIRWRKKSILDLYNKFVWMRCDPSEEYEVSVSDTEIVMQRKNRCNKWVIPIRGSILENFSIQQIWYLLGECAVVKSLDETIKLMHATNTEYNCNYICPIYYARQNRYIIQL